MENQKMDLKEARRVVHNLSMQYQGLLELKKALDSTLDLDKKIIEREKYLAESDKYTKDLGATILIQEAKVKNITKEYDEKAVVLGENILLEIEKLKENKIKQENILNTFVRENQEKVNLIKIETEKVENSFKVRHEELEDEIDNLVKEKNRHEKALIDTKKRMQSLIGDINDG